MGIELKKKKICRKCFDKETDLDDQPCRSCVHNPEVRDRFNLDGIQKVKKPN